MSFIQIIDLHTKDFEELKSLEDQWEKATEGKRTLRRSVITQDRSDPAHYVVLAFFDSYESAMANSALPETSAFAEKQGALLDGPPTFLDLDVIDDRS
jgi:hypothetical protein